MLGFTIIVLQARWSIGALTNKESNKLLWKISGFVAVLSTPLAGRKARQCHHKGIVPPGGKDFPDYPQPCGACYQTRHRSGLGQRRSGYFAKIFRLYRQQYQGKTHEFRIYRPDRWQASAAVKIVGSSEFLIKMFAGQHGLIRRISEVPIPANTFITETLPRR